MHVINTFQVVFVCVCACSAAVGSGTMSSTQAAAHWIGGPFSNQQVLGLTVWLFTFELVTPVAHPMASY